MLNLLPTHGLHTDMEPTHMLIVATNVMQNLLPMPLPHMQATTDMLATHMRIMANVMQNLLPDHMATTHMRVSMEAIEHMGPTHIRMVPINRMQPNMATR